ncbi:hypothetical protein [Mycobacterium sp. 236(2023)]|uniref:hypothetical protein n=1 Tax=Mycobacterium sp. 236(2023) TaxID=3038163 RepID=UPI002415543D|nr:hypothetical protein [Mycobacterium sp. 236(2023)]MDG4668390.1 hypothetical protein [Mycobacterium sp. 236(2023)]
MADRISAWLGAGILTAGVSAATLAGAGIASADEGVSAERAQTTKSSAATERAARADDDPETSDPVDKPDAGVTDADETEAEPGSENRDADEEAVAVEEVAVDEEEEEEVAVTEDEEVAADEAPVEEPSVVKPSLVAAVLTETEPPTSTTELATASAPRPTLLNVVGSFFWGAFDLLTKVVDGPPSVPPGSTLTAGRSRLDIDCGDGYTADADWYFPSEAEPDRFIYFQHGFPARAGFYNVTLQQLAVRNNAIVVAPSITSNIFACDACAASGEPMHAAVARLFEGDRAALLASARAAGYEGTLPEDFVFAGQSAGASLAIAAAGYYYEAASEDDKSDMVGVLLYEVSAIGGAKEGNALTNGLEKLPDTLPVLTIAAEPNMLNSKNNANAVFLEERPDQFNGVQLVGGAHSDAFQSNILFGIPQLIVNVFFGASTPANTEAVHVLTSGWLVDMYAHRVYNPATRTGIYGEPGGPGEVEIDIPTTKGVATARVLPIQAPAPNGFDQVLNFFFGLLNANYYARCVVSEDARQSCPL